MYQIRSRQIARLEKRARPYLEQRMGIAEQWQKVRRGAVTHATVLGFLLRYGEPKIGEPLSKACERVTNSEGWKLYRETMPPLYEGISREEQFTPYSRGEVTVRGEVLRHLFISKGVDEKAKLDAIFKSAPPWLIWFTFADYTAAVLDLTLPDLSGVSGFARSREAFDYWWGFPDGAFERRPWPKDRESEILVRTDLTLLRPEPAQEQFMTHRARKRALAASINWTNKWPSRYSLELLKLGRTDPRAALAQAGVQGFVNDKRHPEFCGDDMSPQARYRGNFPKVKPARDVGE